MKMILVLVLLVSSSAQARLFCAGLFSENKLFVEELLAKKIPAAEVNVGNKKLLIALVNNHTFPEVQQLYAHSLGIVVNHQKGYNNDHGMLRLGDYFIDRDAPGARRDGEINTTGISWSPVKGYVDYAAKSGRSYNRLEVLFELKPAEMRTALIYQKMRRAGIVRPDFVFNGAANPEKNNRLENCGEICFSFSTGSAIDGQVRAIEQKLKSLGVENPHEFIQEPAVRTYLKNISEYLFKAKLDGATLTPTMTTKLDKLGWIKSLLGGERVKKPALLREMSEEDVNWLLGYKTSVDYASLLKALGVSNSSTFSNVNAPRASAVMVYDANVTQEKFLSDDYTSEGVFSTWRNFESVALQDAR